MLSPADQDRVATAVEQDAQVMSDTQLEEILAEEPADVRAEVVRINDEARDRALQVALLVPIIAGAVGFVNALRMRRLARSRTVVLGRGDVAGLTRTGGTAR